MGSCCSSNDEDDIKDLSDVLDVSILQEPLLMPHEGGRVSPLTIPAGCINEQLGDASRTIASKQNKAKTSKKKSYMAKHTMSGTTVTTKTSGMFIPMT